jgi:hypothetical protein
MPEGKEGSINRKDKPLSTKEMQNTSGKLLIFGVYLSDKKILNEKEVIYVIRNNLRRSKDAS